MRGGIAVKAIAEQESSKYALLTEESRKVVDWFIAFLYEKEAELNDETKKALSDSRNRKNLVGPFESVDDLMRSLNA